MVDQLGPKKLFMDELRNEAPRYAKLLPELPRLLVSFLQGNQSELQRHQLELLQEQKRTNRLLQSLATGAWVSCWALLRCSSWCGFASFGLRSTAPEKRRGVRLRGLAPGAGCPGKVYN